MRTGDLHILAALLGVGVVSSPLARSGAQSSAVEAAPRSAPLPKRTIHARPAAVAAAPEAPPAPVATRAAPNVVEGTLARVEGLADRGFSLVVDAHGVIDQRVTHGPFMVDGRATLVHVAASWCKPCVDDLAAFIGLASRAPRVVFVAAEDVGGPAGLSNVLESLAAKAEASSRALPVGLELRADPSWSWMAWLGHESLPLTAVIDPAGVLRIVVEGPLDDDAIERVTRALGGDA